MEEVIYYTADEKGQIEAAYQSLLKAIKSPLDKTDSANIRLAYELAVDAHSQQRRKSGEPYIFHPIEVARICVAEIGLGPTAVICALLHDVVEDTDITLKDLSDKFGGKVARIVDGLTKLDSSYNSESPQAENFKKVISTLIEDVRVVLIKMADRLHNMRTLGAMPRHKQLKIAAETSYIYGPLAHRLGLYAIKTEYQDLCMKITDSETYQSIAKKLAETKRSRNAYINEFIEPLSQELEELDIPYRVLGRPKSIYSIWNKIKNKKVEFEEIYDLFAVRIILDVPPKKEKSACWLFYSTVTDIYNPIPERLKDWVTTPKSNGYESLHTTVIGPKGRFVEVQIRSERMDEIAERGFAAHWKYKGVSSQPDVYDKWLDNVRDILDNPNANALEFVSDFKTNLFSEEVYVFTPKGDMRILPKGATGLDFAFEIHTDVGYKCTGVKVNNKIVPMGYKLQNGDQVSVLTNPKQRPNENWLKLVVTGKARSKIRSSMKEERRKQGEFGKEAIVRKFKNLKISDFEASVDVLVKQLGMVSHVDLYYAISLGQIVINDLMKDFEVIQGKLAKKVIKVEEVVAPKEDENAATKNRRKPETPKLLINGESGNQYDYSFASCCKPVQGDPIFGYITATTGLKIHRANCPNSTHLMANYGYRILKADWGNSTNTDFVVDLKITGNDGGVGIIEKLTHEISSNLGVNIRSFSIEGHEGYFEGRISLFVHNANQLHLATKTIQNLEYISTVERLN